MNYTEQQQFLTGSRMWGATIGALLLVVAAICVGAAPALSRAGIVLPFSLAVMALLGSLYYTPDYLHLTVNWTRRPDWEIKVRWRILAVGLVLGLLSESTWPAVMVFAIAWLAGVNLLAKLTGPRRYYAAYFWATDFALLAVLLLGGWCGLLLGGVLLAAAAHLSVVICEKYSLWWAGTITVMNWILIVFLAMRHRADLKLALAAAALVLVSAMGTALLVRRADMHNARNIAAAMRELIEFTGYSPDRIWHLWSVSNQELAKNWQLAGIAEDDRERLAEWYRQNSELYLFAISAYNLDYRRIRSNLKVLRFAQGTCLDYGAGNGELILELARRGHGAAYYDVEGTTMKFARQRASQHSLNVEFCRSKEELAEAARQHGFDTVFAFDVLEHLPDLPGELNFLSSLLNPRGVMVFDVPAGSTRSHPMHLNHNLHVRNHLRNKGMEEERTLIQKLPFRKEEKYMFRKAANSN